LGTAGGGKQKRRVGKFGDKKGGVQWQAVLGRQGCVRVGIWYREEWGMYDIGRVTTSELQRWLEGQNEQKSGG